MPAAENHCAMRRLHRPALPLLPLAALLVLVACGPTSRTIEDYQVIADTSGLEREDGHAPALIYTRPGAPSLRSYTRFIVDPVQVDYSDPGLLALDPDRVGEMQRYFRDAVVRELRDAGYRVHAEPEARTLRISLTVSGLSAWDYGGAANVATMAGGMALIGPPAMIAVSVGEVTIEGVFRDATTGRIDAVVVERVRGSRRLNSSPWSAWADIRETFDLWAEGIRQAVDDAPGR